LEGETKLKLTYIIYLKALLFSWINRKAFKQVAYVIKVFFTLSSPAA
jgi:hypothetical protein